VTENVRLAKRAVGRYMCRPGRVASCPARENGWRNSMEKRCCLFPMAKNLMNGWMKWTVARRWWSGDEHGYVCGQATRYDLRRTVALSSLLPPRRSSLGGSTCARFRPSAPRKGRAGSSAQHRYEKGSDTCIGLALSWWRKRALPSRARDRAHHETWTRCSCHGRLLAKRAGQMAPRVSGWKRLCRAVPCSIHRAIVFRGQSTQPSNAKSMLLGEELHLLREEWDPTRPIIRRSSWVLLCLDSIALGHKRSLDLPVGGGSTAVPDTLFRSKLYLPLPCGCELWPAWDHKSYS
jgi:hypothetical protein